MDGVSREDMNSILVGDQLEGVREGCAEPLNFGRNFPYFLQYASQFIGLPE
jgi:cytochrome bd-type quinol oxidase subunit 1